MDKPLTLAERLETMADECAKCAPELREAASIVRAVEGAWQPIETAPTDHLPRLYLCRGRVVQGFVDVTGRLTVQHELGWRAMRRVPSHWRPLPAPPARVPVGQEAES